MAIYSRHRNHFEKPIIIDGPGKYRTQFGETVTIQFVEGYDAYGEYDEDKIQESWHVSGRVNVSSKSRNDIVEKITTDVVA